MSRLKYILTGLAVIGCQSVAMAQVEAEHAAEEPGLFAGGLWTSFWTLVVFVILLIALSKFAWKPLLAALKKREDSIRDDLASAKRDREDAEKSLLDLKQQLTEAEAKAQAFLKQSTIDSEKIRDAIIAQAQAEVTETLKDARLQLVQAKHQAMKELYAQTVELAGGLAGKILQREVNEEDHRILIEQGLHELDLNEGEQ
jgi:F-type H+-transporting ATPase subunit b